MCGILLHLGKERINPDHPALEIIKHRGPDDFGAVNFSLGDMNLGMGHRRLSIIDLSEKGHQPMPYADENMWVIFNGEIYNYLEIKKELEAKGYSFNSDSDTEVLLAAYAEWGVECLKHFNGMFAFCLFDKKQNNLFIARDRFGIKPLHYHNSPKGFSVFSEIKQVTKFSYFTSRVNKSQLYHFLNSGDFNFSEETLWHGVFSIPQGSYALINLDTWKPGDNLHITKWYTPPLDSVIDISYEDAIAEFKRLLEASVSMRLRSDVPVGFLLSGGLDSSTLVCLAHNSPRYANNKLRTYSSCYDDEIIDERKYIKAVADFAKADSCLHFPKAEDIPECLDNVIWHNDLPILPGSPCSHWLIYQHIKQEMDSRIVIIEGQGADEILCGYGDFQWTSIYEKMKLKSAPSFISQFLSFQKHHHEPVKTVLRKFKRLLFLESLKYPPNSILRHQTLLESDDIPPIAVRREEKNIQALHRNRLTILRYMLHYVDRNSMSHSRETRVPFLDHNLVEFCLKLPTNFKIDKGFSKRVMRDSVGDILPDLVKYRTDKLGYSSPIPKWVKSELKPFFSKEIKKCGELPFINQDNLAAKVEELLKQGGHFDPILWRVVTLNRWMRIFNINI
jgi:asparagine synthase (glutamine-hydrolysing)